MRCSSKCPLCYAGRKGRAFYKGHYGYVPSRPRRPAYFFGVEHMLKKRSPLSPDHPQAWQPEAVGLPDLPDLAEFLFCPIWPEDGSKRETGTIMLFVDDGRLKAVLTDRAQSLVAFLSIDQPLLLLDELNAHMGSDRLDWRVKKEWRPPGGKK